MSLKFYIESYGCSLNSADSDIMVGRLHQLQYERVGTPDEASLIIINTCGVKEPTEDKIVHRLTEFSDVSKPVIVTGCLPRISIARVRAAIPHFAALLGPQSIDSLGPIVQRVMDGERGIVHLSSDSESKLRFFEGPPNSAICTVPICEGCLGDCTYCAVRFARGSVRSYSIREIRDVVERCVCLGYREIRLTSQDAGAFGHDTGEDLACLLGELDSIEGPQVYRLGMFNANLVTKYLREMLNTMKSDHFFRFFHIPLQSGSDRILAAMKRRYLVADWAGLVREIRNVFPEATIATDIIVGFPGESEEDFRLTMESISRTRPDLVNISKYGDRPRTIAASSTNKVPTDTKKRRSRTLSALVQTLTEESNRRLLGWTGSVLVTESGPRGGMIGRLPSYRPVVVRASVHPGTVLRVEIVSSTRTHLKGNIQARG